MGNIEHWVALLIKTLGESTGAAVHSQVAVPADIQWTYSYKANTYTATDLQSMKWGFSGPSKFKVEPLWVDKAFEPPKPEPPPWNPRPDQCPHCLRPWHNGPLTETVKNMFELHSFDPNYDPDEDDSSILCVGSDHQGPPRPPRRWSYVYEPNIFQDAIKLVDSFGVEPKWWTVESHTPVPKKLKVDGEIVQFGKYPVGKVDVYEIDEHILAVQEAADQFQSFIELPDMKADYQSLVDKVQTKEFNYANL